MLGKQMLNPLLRTSVRPRTLVRSISSTLRAPAITQLRSIHTERAQETFEAFTDRHISFFQSCKDVFELQKGLNNCFAHDLAPAPSVIEAALRAARRVGDHSTAVRVFEGVRKKVESKAQYKTYMEELMGVREELGIQSKEELSNV